LEVVDVSGIWRSQGDLVEYGQEVVEAPDGRQGWCFWAAQGASSGSEEESCSDTLEGNGAALKFCGQLSVLTAGRVACAG